MASGTARSLCQASHADVDLANGILLIRKTKFRKDRLVPVHTTTQAALRSYVHERDAAFPTPKTRPFSSALVIEAEVATPLSDVPVDHEIRRSPHAGETIS